MSSPRSRVVLFPVVVVWTRWRSSPSVTWHLGPVRLVVVSVGGWVGSGTYLATHSSSSLSTVGARPWVVGVAGRGRRRRAVAGFLRGGMVRKSGVGLELGGSWGEKGMDPLTWHLEGLEVLWARNFTRGRFVR